MEGSSLPPDGRRIAIVSDQVAEPASDLPYGTPRSSHRLSSEIARLTPADLLVGFQGEEPLPTISEGFLCVRRAVDLMTLSRDYRAIYVPTGLLFGLPHGLRPEASDVPVVCDIGTTLNVAQWMHLATGLLTGLVRNGDGLIFKSRRTREHFQVTIEDFSSRLKQGVHLESAVIPNGVDTARHRRDPHLRRLARSWLKTTEGVVFLTWGRLSPFGKVDYESLIRAWALSAASRGDAVLVIAGEVVTHPDYRPYPRRLLDVATELGVAHSVVVVTNPSRLWADARRFLMSAADAFIHTTRGVEESMSLALLEAMSFGLAPIVSDWAGMPDLVREGSEGIVVPVELRQVPPPCTRPWVLDETRLREGLEANVKVDERKLAHAIDVLNDNDELRHGLAGSARRRVESEFTWRAVAESRLSFIDDLSRRPKTNGERDDRPGVLPDLQLLLALLAGEGRTGSPGARR